MVGRAPAVAGDNRFVIAGQAALREKGDIMPTLKLKPTFARAGRNLLCASAVVFALHACATAPSPLTAEDLLVAPYALRGGEAFDVDRMFAALPDWLIVDHGGASFDPGLGAMVVSDVTFAFASAPEARLRADRAVIWGADAAAMETVFSGVGSLTDMAPLLDRLSFENVTSEGLQWETGTENASLSLQKFVIDGLAARSYALAPKPGADEGAGVLRHIAAVMGAFAYDGVAYSGFSLKLNNSRGDKVAFDLAEAFARGYRSGDVDYQSVSGLAMTAESFGGEPLVEVSGKQESEKAAADHPYAKILNRPPAETARDIVRHPTAFLAAAAGGGVLAYEIDGTEARNVSISKALAWLAKWELPPISETDLIDLGQQTMTGYRQIWNGQAYYTIESADISAADFYWLVPSHYEVAYQGVTYDMGVMMDQTRYSMGPGMATEAAPQFEQMAETLSALGLERIAGDGDLVWRWNGETGDAALATSGDIIDNFSLAYGVNVGGPSLAEWDVMARDETLAKDAVGGMTLQGADFAFTDSGFVDRAFAFAAAQNGAGSGEELRQAVSGMVRVSGLQAGQMNPRLTAYAQAFADFLDNGGTISATAAPAAPVEFMTLQAASQTAPQTLPDLLNLTVTHTEE